MGRRTSQSGKDVARRRIRTYLRGLDAARAAGESGGPQPFWHEARPDQYTISLAGSAGQPITIEITLGEYTIQLMGFFMRAPDENALDTYRLLLRRNVEMPFARFGVDEFGDIYLRADIPVTGVTEQDLDRVVGAFYSCANDNYMPVMRLGFASGLRQ